MFKFFVFAVSIEIYYCINTANTEEAPGLIASTTKLENKLSTLVLVWVFREVPGAVNSIALIRIVQVVL